MAYTVTVLTLRLAEAIGLYCFAAGIGILIGPDRWRAIVEDMERLPALAYVSGAAAFAIGAAILIPHHILADPLAAIVTIIAVLILIEGLALLAVPQAFLALARPFLAAPRLWGIAAIVIGALLFLAGLTGRADAVPQGV